MSHVCLLAYIDLRPFWFAGGVMAIAFLVGVRWYLSPRSYRFSRPFLWATFVWTLLFWIPMTVFVGIEKELTFDASWNIDRTAEASTVTLTYVDFPEHHEIVRSMRIANWLNLEAPKTVEIVVTVTYDFGKVRAYGLERVGDFEVNSTFERQNGNPPWQAFR